MVIADCSTGARLQSHVGRVCAVEGLEAAYEDISQGYAYLCGCSCKRLLRITCARWLVCIQSDNPDFVFLPNFRNISNMEDYCHASSFWAYPTNHALYLQPK